MRLHHDFEVWHDEQLPLAVRTLVVAHLLADHIVQGFDSATPEADWQAHGHASMKSWGVTEIEIADWTDSLHQAFASPSA